MASYCLRSLPANREQFGTRWSLKKGSRARMIEFFKEPNIDWMGKAKYFYALSAILLLAGGVSIFAKGGLYYGIDFKGGTNVDVRFAQPPNIDHLRSALTARGLGNSEIQSIGNVGAGNSNEVLIFVGQNEMSDEAHDSSKAQVLAALNAAYNSENAGKPDLNAATPSSLAAYLTQKDPLNLSAAAGERDRKSTRLNSSHSQISYAVFCLKKKKKKKNNEMYKT